MKRKGPIDEDKANALPGTSCDRAAALYGRLLLGEHAFLD
jgi:hypothetical protein